mmetsp:Transcript_50351/g.146075  ORF Transcript_50351/g.146075 Transcript_50351/m.146075 type:complete len:91 (-) Transcript_50351:778-1050(-)
MRTRGVPLSCPRDWKSELEQPALPLYDSSVSELPVLPSREEARGPWLRALPRALPRALEEEAPCPQEPVLAVVPSRRGFEEGPLLADGRA